MKKFFESIIFVGIKIITFDYYIVKKLIKKYKGAPTKVLDLGSGNGHLANLFPPKSYLGIELDAGLVEVAKKNYPNHRFEVGNITRLNLKTKFDLVLVVGVLHHLNQADFKKALTRISRVLSPYGRVLIIEAIPPISRFNVLGRALRNFDRGEFVRTLRQYKTEIDNLFKVYTAENVKGGVVDYAFFILGQK